MENYLSKDNNHDKGKETYPQLSIYQNEDKVWHDFTQGSNTALSYIYRKYSESLFNYGLQFINEAEVYDAIQDLFYELIQNRRNLGNAKNIKAYLFACLRRKILKSKKQYRKELSQTDVEERNSFKLALAHEEPISLLNVNQENLQLLQIACNQLPEKQREAILLYFYEKMTYEDLARILKIGKVKSARALVYRAVENLRTMLLNHKDELIFLLAGVFNFLFS